MEAGLLWRLQNPKKQLVAKANQPFHTGFFGGLKRGPRGSLTSQSPGLGAWGPFSDLGGVR